MYRSVLGVSQSSPPVESLASGGKTSNLLTPGSPFRFQSPSRLVLWFRGLSGGFREGTVV